MISLPSDFDTALLFGDFISLAVPFVSIAFLIATGLLIIRLLKRC